MKLSETNKRDISTAMRAWRTVRSRPRKCMCPDCKETRIIDSHSLSQSFPLKAIAVDGWVYQPQFRDMGRILSRSYTTGNVYPTIGRVETSKASVFNWYCGYHDNQLFKHIDVSELNFNDEQQVREVYLRAMSRNIANLEDGVFCVEEFDKIRKQMGIVVEPAISGSLLAYESDIRRLWNPFWESKAPGVIKWYWRILEGNLGISVSAMYPMAGDLNTERWFYYCGARPMVALSVIPQENGLTHVVFAWWCEWDQTMQTFKTMLEQSSDKDFLHVLNRIVVTKLDGLCISPTIWEGLSQEERLRVEYFQQTDDCQDPKVSVPKLISCRNFRVMRKNITHGEADVRRGDAN